MPTNILVLNANPRQGSLSDGLAQHYTTAATDAGADVTHIAVRDLTFDPALHGGYKEPTPLEPDLIDFQEKLAAADHFTIVTPLWWNGVPAPFKGLIDRAFLPGFNFRYVEGKALPEKLLSGRSARIMITMDTPSIYQLVYAGDTAIRMLKRNVIGFSGFKPVHVNRFTPIHNVGEEKIASYLAKAAQAGSKDGARQVTDQQRAARKHVKIGTLEKH